MNRYFLFLMACVQCISCAGGRHSDRQAERMASIFEAIRSYSVNNNDRVPFSSSQCESGYSWRYKIAVYLEDTKHEQVFDERGWESESSSWWKDHPPLELRSSNTNQSSVFSVRCSSCAMEPNTLYSQLPTKQILFFYSDSRAVPWMSPCDFELNSDNRNGTVGDEFGGNIMICLVDGTIASVPAKVSMSQFLNCCSMSGPSNYAAWDAMSASCMILHSPDK